MKDTLRALSASTWDYLATNEVPNPERKAPQELADAVDTVLGIAGWAGTAAGVAGIIITGVMMAASVKRGEGSEHMSRLGMVLGGCVLVSTAGPVVSFFFTA
ncbi:hypothetical protein ABTZ59_12410 [Streptomyces sp. NPDC094034]|uniref:hypothetical protein n=1 Tax=Streptomyces sp. NPDC094034 TaxID=3155309 RepID=UPI00331D3815